MAEAIELEKIKPMLAEIGTKEDLKRKDLIFEPKLDGTRAIVYIHDMAIRILNRRGNWIEYRYPELYKIWHTIRCDSAVLDGEIVVLDEKGRPDFSKLVQREHQEKKLNIEILSREMPATLVVFDILELDGEDLRSKPLWDRKQILQKVVVERPQSRVTKIFYTHDGEALWKTIKEKKLEGVIAKDAQSPYLAGKRTDAWLKIKALKTLDVVIGGYTIGKGGRAKTFGALLCGVWHKGQLRHIGRVGTGWDEKQLEDYTKVLQRLETKENPFGIFEESPAVTRAARWLKPQIVAEVEFLQLTPDLKMRAPAFKRLRLDKAPEECTLTEKDVLKLRAMKK